VTKWQYWGGWALALTVFWLVGYFVIRAAVIAAYLTVQGRR
jgi:hypothetical protein